MASPKRSKVVLSTLDVVIQDLNLAKDACGVPPAQIALSSASVLLTTIRVRFPLLREAEPLTHIHLGYYSQRSRLRRAWADLR